MKTATVTWSSFNNYGTLLQAYALQKEVQKLGYENTIISDEYVLKTVKEKSSADMSRKGADQQNQGTVNRILGLVREPKRIPRIICSRINRVQYERPYYASQELCNQFRRDDLNILYGKTMDQMPDLNQSFDCFLCGSDQIWSVLTGIFSPYYFLNFAEKKKIAYAPSIGTDRISSKSAVTIQHLVSDFDALSVREYSSAQWLTTLSKQEVSWVVDPTLLHGRTFWSTFTEGVPVMHERYLLCYFLENKPWYFEYAKRLAKQYHLKLYLVPNSWEHLSHGSLITEGVGPKEFVSLIQHAEFVLTDSYHGSIFSVIFEKEFRYLLRFDQNDPSSQNIRVHSLFSMLGLNDRIVSNSTEEPKEEPINYKKLSETLEVFRRDSEIFLKNALGE